MFSRNWLSTWTKSETFGGLHPYHVKEDGRLALAVSGTPPSIRMESELPRLSFARLPWMPRSHSTY